ncbi:MAG: hypothetical protein HFG81_02855 [Dorea sp.]|nr:hypothetical protein [Dorea sp.]
MRQKKQKEFKSGRAYRRKTAALLFFGLLILISLLELIPLEQDFSKKENRPLATRPKLAWEDVADGSFMDKYEAFRSDQFLGRNLWVSLKNRIDLLMGKRESNGVFKGKDDYLLEDIKEADQEKLHANLKAMADFGESYEKVPIYLALAPNAANILSDKLPRFAVTKDQNGMFREISQELSERVAWVDLSKTLAAHKKEEIYYRTDTHWTTLGAYYASQQLVESMQLDEAKTPKWEKYVVTNIFTGDLSLKSGYQTGYQESIYIYTAKNDKEMPQIVVDAGEGKISTLYDRTKLKEMDAYDLFLGGSKGMVNIRTTADTTDRLLLVKDSYANCLIPFLVPYFREIIVIDPEFYEGNLNDIMGEKKISRVLFLYSGNTFVQDDKISGVLQDG